MKSKYTAILILIAVMAILFLQGCQGETSARVFGHVLKDKQNQIGFKVVLTGSDGTVYTSEPVSENGSYQVDKVRTGDYVITVLDAAGNQIPGYEKTIYVKAGEPQKIEILL